MKAIFFVLFSVFTVLLSTSNAQSEQEMIQAYFDRLKSRNYNTKIAPPGTDGHGSAIQVRTTMYIINIHKIDDFNMDYRASFYLRQKWNDSRLAYSDMDISMITLTDDQFIWTPDLFLVQEKDGRKHTLTTPNIYVRITPEGEVLYSIRLTVTFTCDMDFRNYPHDSQHCKFSIESYAKRMEEMTLDWDTNAGFEAVSATTKDINVLPYELVSYTYGARNEKVKFGNYRCLDVTLEFKRKVGFYITRLYVPFIILVILSWLSFWIKAKLAVLRVPLLLVIMYIMLNIGSDISSYIPPAPYTKASDVWIAVCESLVFTAFLEFIFVSIVARSEKKYEKKRSSSSSDPEAPIISVSDGKETPASSEKLNSAFKVVASRLSKSTKLSQQIDVVSRVLFPALFVLFNFVYWIVY